MTATQRKWAERVRRWRESGLTAGEFSAGQGFRAGLLRQWAYQLKKLGAASGATTKGAAPAVLRVARVDRVAAVASAAALTIEIGPARLHVLPGADQATLRATIDALIHVAQRVPQ